MNRMFFSNLSRRTVIMTEYLNRKEICVRACETTKNQYQGLPLTATIIIINIIDMTKGILRINVPPVVVVTRGLPKSRKRYGNGGLIVTATKTQVFSNTPRVMFRKCEVIQRRGLTTYNLSKRTVVTMGNKKLVQNLNNNRFYLDKICNPDRLIRAYELISKSEANNGLSIDRATLDIYSRSTIYNLSNSLKDHSFKFEPIKRVEIPKPNGGV